MIYCNICGLSEEEKVRYYPEKRQSLCADCAKHTPSKIGRTEFDRKYWGVKFAETPEGIRKEFYSDYLTSGSSFTKYKQETVSQS